MELCGDSSRQMTSNAQLNNIYGVCQGVEGTSPPECTPCQRSILANLAKFGQQFWPNATNWGNSFYYTM